MSLDHVWQFCLAPLISGQTMLTHSFFRIVSVDASHKPAQFVYIGNSGELVLKKKSKKQEEKKKKKKKAKDSSDDDDSSR